MVDLDNLTVTRDYTDKYRVEKRRPDNHKYPDPMWMPIFVYSYETEREAMYAALGWWESAIAHNGAPVCVRVVRVSASGNIEILLRLGYDEHDPPAFD